jgi:HPt (histidine-containing phosphotransfer) domain-containing protein
MVQSLNSDHLARQTEGDAELQREIMALFVENADALITSIARLAADDARDAIHRLKGSALAVGADRLVALCSAAETRGQSAAFPQIVAEMTSELVSIRVHAHALGLL